jgi:hypothetical protein
VYTIYTCDGDYWECLDDSGFDVGNVFSPPDSTYCQMYASMCNFTIQQAGGYANPTQALPTPDSPGSPDSSDDAPASKPDCSKQQTDSLAIAWCLGAAPTGMPLLRINAAIRNMDALGGICSTLASVLNSLLTPGRGDLHIFPATAVHVGGSAPRNGGSSGPDSWMAISNFWTEFAWDQSHVTINEPVPRDLQQILAHEADHLMNNGHIDPGHYSTTNSAHCGGF